MIDAKMKRTMKWNTSLKAINRDAALEKYWREEVKNMSTEDLKLVLNAHYGINPEPINPIVEKIIMDELKDRNKEES